MADPNETLRRRLVAAVNEPDLFRVIIVGFGILEDMLEQRIAAMLPEPLEGLGATPFRHKLNLAVGLGIVPPEARSPLGKLATLRHGLAHANRDPTEITAAECEAICRPLDPEGDLPAIRPGSTISTRDAAALAIVAAAVTIEAGGDAAREYRERERTALQRELQAQRPMSPLLRSVIAQAAAATNAGAQTGARARDPAEPSG